MKVNKNERKRLGVRANTADGESAERTVGEKKTRKARGDVTL